jgi:hypothetical protein
MESMKPKLILFSIVLIIVISACHHIKKPFIQRIDECTKQNKTKEFENQFYPFMEKNYSTSKMVRYFSDQVKIDSGYDLNSNRDTIRYYKFFDDKSRFIFALDNNIKKGEADFDIAIFEINSDLLKFKNGIQYKTTRKNFFKALNYNEVDCDTFDIHEQFNGYYFRFVLKDDSIISIRKQYIE